MPDAELRDRSATRHRKPPELAKRYWLHSPRGDGIPRTSRACIFSPSWRWCDYAARDFGGEPAHPVLSRFSKGTRMIRPVLGG